nr:uncharacterized protein LOC104115602 [Nicotiana tomentosiformis]
MNFRNPKIIERNLFHTLSFFPSNLFSLESSAFHRVFRDCASLKKVEVLFIKEILQVLRWKESNNSQTNHLSNTKDMETDLSENIVEGFGILSISEIQVRLISTATS